MIFQRGAIFEIPRFFKIWRDSKTNNMMYRKDMSRDWNSPHFLDCGWYIDYLKENTPSKFEIQKKHESRFVLGSWSLGEGDINQEETRGGKEERKKMDFGVCIIDVRQGICSHSIP